MIDRCPKCGYNLRADHLLSGALGESVLVDQGWYSVEGRSFASGDALPAGTELERRKPARAPQRDDVVVAFLWSAGTWFGLLVAGVMLAFVFGDGVWAVRGVVAGVGVALVLWFSLLRQGQALLWEDTRVRRMVENGKEARGGGGRSSVDVYVAEDPSGAMEGLSGMNLPVSEDQLRRVAVVVMEQGENFSRPGLVDRRRILSQTEFHGLKDRMIQLGLLRKAGNSHLLTRKGEAVMRALV